MQRCYVAMGIAGRWRNDGGIELWRQAHVVS